MQQQRARTLPRLAMALFGLAAVAGIIAFVLLSSGSDSKSKTAASAAAGPVNVRLTDFKIAPTVSTHAAGKVTFVAANAGGDVHEMVVVRTDKRPSELLKGNAASEAGAVGEIGEFKPGGTKRVTLNLKPGHYVLLCNVPGHFKAGMFKNFIVK